MSALTIVGTTLQGAFGGVIVKVFEKLFSFVAGYLGIKWAQRLTAVALLASIYLACVATFTAWIGPLFGALVTTSYGFILGLLFPPISGTIVAGLMLYRMCVVGVKYTSRLVKMAVG